MKCRDCLDATIQVRLLVLGALFVWLVVRTVRGKSGHILWLLTVAGGLLFVVVSLFVPLLPALRHCF
jgi:hypothetical protein